MIKCYQNLTKVFSELIHNNLAEVGSASRESCAASARATTLKILRQKRFHKPKKIIAPQAQV